MATFTIRNLDDEVKRRLRIRAAEHGRSMEEEARAISQDAVARSTPTDTGLGTETHALFEALGGVDLELPPREPPREPPRFD